VGGAARQWRFAQPGVERGAADPRRPGMACLPGMLPLLFPCSVVFVFVFRGATLIGLRLLVTGAGTPRPRQVQRS
jgi:hypothetical protein